MNLPIETAETEALKIIHALIAAGHYTISGVKWESATGQIVKDAQTITKGLAGKFATEHS